MAIVCVSMRMCFIEPNPLNIFLLNIIFHSFFQCVFGDFLTNITNFPLIRMVLCNSDLLCMVFLCGESLDPQKCMFHVIFFLILRVNLHSTFMNKCENVLRGASFQKCFLLNVMFSASFYVFNLCDSNDFFLGNYHFFSYFKDAL